MRTKESAEERSARRATNAAVVCAILTIVVQIGGYFLSVRDKHKEDVMEHRRQALFTAMEVVDHIYCNTAIAGKPPVNPHTWDIALARKAMNEIIIYCKDPNKVLASFSKAIGLHEINAEPASFRPIAITEFRDVVCDELDVSHIRYADTNIVWIYSLAGAK